MFSITHVSWHESQASGCAAPWCPIYISPRVGGQARIGNPENPMLFGFYCIKWSYADFAHLSFTDPSFLIFKSIFLSCSIQILSFNPIFPLAYMIHIYIYIWFTFSHPSFFVPWAQVSTTLGQANHVEQEGLRCAVHLLAYLLEGGRVHDKLIYSYLGSEVGWKRWVFYNAEKGILMGFYGILMDFRRILMGFYRVSLDCNAAYFAKLANRTLKTIG